MTCVIRLLTGGEAAEGTADDHAWTSRAVDDSRTESLHSDGSCVRWTLHRSVVGACRLPRYVLHAAMNFFYH